MLLPPHLKIKQIAAGNEFTLILSSDEVLYSFGFNGSGQLGLGNTTSVHTPTAIAAPSGCSKIKGAIAANGCEHCFAISEDGYVWGMGYNNYGQLGINSQANSPSPVPLLDLKDYKIKSAACSYYHSVFIGTLKSSSEKHILSCGRNENGQVSLCTYFLLRK